MDLELQKNKIDFVSNLNGTSLFEVNLISSVSTLAYLLRCISIAFLPKVLSTHCVFRFLFDFTFIFVSLMLSVTLWSGYNVEIFVLLFVLCVSLILWINNSKPDENLQLNAKTLDSKVIYEFVFETSNYDDLNVSDDGQNSVNKNSFSIDNLLLSSNLNFITMYRSFVSIATCIFILAVDFHAFPRRFAKTEKFGVGAMDLGVGGFVIANALVSPEARFWSKKKQTLHNIGLTLYLKIVSTWPIIALGLIRLVVVMTSMTNQHVSEYGVHWNFFFTLATVRILSTFLLTFLKPRQYTMVAVLVITVYQTLLCRNSAKLTEFLLSEEHSGTLFMQNKEGIASCVGLLALYFAGIAIGMFLFKPRCTLGEWKKAAFKLAVLTAAMWIALYACIAYIQPVSRRLGNLSYVLWILSHATLFLLQYLCIDLILVTLIAKGKLAVECMPSAWLDFNIKTNEGKPLVLKKSKDKPLCIFSAVNFNQLFFFLLCNLLTGFVNMSIDTLSVSDKDAFVIVCCYCFLASGVVWCLNYFYISLKFW